MAWILLFACGAALLSYPLSDHDLWWHLAAGREMTANPGWLRTDPFCASSEGARWIDLHWGFQLLVYGIHRMAGLPGLVALRVLLVLGSLGVALRGRISWETALCGCVGIAMCRTFLDLRPLLVSLILLAVLWRTLESSPTRWTLPIALLLQLGLVNVQGLFLLGPLFALASASGRLLEGQRLLARQALFLSAAMTLVSLANPWGTESFHLATLVAGRITSGGASVFSREIPENAGWISWILTSPTDALLPLWLGLFTFAFWRSGGGAKGRLLLLAGTFALSLLAVRNLPLLVLASLFGLEPPKAPWPMSRWIAPSVALGLAGFCLLESRWSLPGSWIAPTHLPSAETLRRLDPSRGAVFHELRAGGWMSWQDPARKTCWADTRLVLHDEAFVIQYLEALDHPEDFDRWSDARRFHWVLAPTSAWPRWKPLATHLVGSPRWRLVHADGAWALFEKADPDQRATSFPRDSVELELHRRFGANPRLDASVINQWRSLLSLGTER